MSTNISFFGIQPSSISTNPSNNKSLYSTTTATTTTAQFDTITLNEKDIQINLT